MSVLLSRRSLGLSALALAMSAATGASAAEYGFKDLVQGTGATRVGAADADVVIVMYADYNCGFCKRMEPVLAKALKADPRLAVVHKEWPIFGAVSEHAARVALAASYQGRYEAVHRAFLLSPTRLSDAPMIDTVARQAGADGARLAGDLKAHRGDIDAILARNEREAGLLGLQGTPGLVINGYLLRGALSDEDLKTIVQNIRALRSAPPSA